jgi:hypothetical protein
VQSTHAVTHKIIPWVIVRQRPSAQAAWRSRRGPRVSECGDGDGTNEAVTPPCMGGHETVHGLVRRRLSGFCSGVVASSLHGVPGARPDQDRLLAHAPLRSRHWLRDLSPRRPGGAAPAGGRGHTCHNRRTARNRQVHAGRCGQGQAQVHRAQLRADPHGTGRVAGTGQCQRAL